MGAFPQLTPAYYDILLERIKDKGFTNKRLTDSVNNVIDNCPYPLPALANILSWDKKIKTFSYSQICDMVTVRGYDKTVWDEFKAIKRNPTRYSSIEDIETYNLTIV